MFVSFTYRTFGLLIRALLPEPLEACYAFLFHEETGECIDYISESGEREDAGEPAHTVTFVLGGPWKLHVEVINGPDHIISFRGYDPTGKHVFHVEEAPPVLLDDLLPY